MTDDTRDRKVVAIRASVHALAVDAEFRQDACPLGLRLNSSIAKSNIVVDGPLDTLIFALSIIIDHGGNHLVGGTAITSNSGSPR